MKKLQITLCTLAVAVLAIGSAGASTVNWRFNVNVDDGSGSYSGTNMMIGVHPSATDGVDPYDVLASSNFSYTDQSLVAACMITGSTDIWQRDMMAGDGTLGNIWNFRVAGMPNSDVSTMRLVFSMLNNSAIQPPVGNNIIYSLIMVNNQGVANAPANGTVWDISMPAFYTSDYFFTLGLPVLKITSDSLMASNGYEFNLVQGTAAPVPEPGTLAVMLTCISGLAGYGMLRRRIQA